MKRTMLKCKIHRATITQAELDYVGSITIDTSLMQAADLWEYEKVQVVNINTGDRLETYVIAGAPGSGQICLNGAAARCAQVGDKVIIMAYASMSDEEARQHKPTVVFMNDDNRIEVCTHYEKHGALSDMLRSS